VNIENIPSALQARTSSIGWGKGLGLALWSIGMLTLSLEPIGWWILAWFALVPWIIASVRAPGERTAAAISYACGLWFFLINLRWLWPVTGAGYIALCFYLALYFLLTGTILRRVDQHHPWPYTLVLPLLWVGQEYLRATVMTGFPWLFLSHTQHNQERLIQISDNFGAYGVTFLVGMTNGLICDLLLRPLKKPAGLKGLWLNPVNAVLLTACAIAAATGYGAYRLHEARTTLTEGPVISVIQEVIPQYVKEEGESTEEIFERHMALSKQAMAASMKPDLIVWPETMANTPLNDEFVELNVSGYDLSRMQSLQMSRRFDQKLRSLAKENVSVLVGCPAVELKDFGDSLKPVWSSNSAILYLPGGEKFLHRYDKMHLVPFGEVVPFKKSIPWLHRILNHLTPYDYDYTLDAGENPTVFQSQTVASQNQSSHAPSQYRFAVAICYEDVMPWVPRSLAKTENGRKRVDFLLNISNDGWFGTGGRSEPLRPSPELLQHLAICKFRAVENRVGIVRAVNTGISGFIRPDGTVQGDGLSGTLPEKPRDRQIVSGYLTDRAWLDSRVSVYSQIGDVFAKLCTAGFFILLLEGFAVRRWKINRMKK